MRVLFEEASISITAVQKARLQLLSKIMSGAPPQEKWEQILADNGWWNIQDKKLIGIEEYNWLIQVLVEMGPQEAD
jgi:hypothetical protein